jgi:hypothetical protein
MRVSMYKISFRRIFSLRLAVQRVLIFCCLLVLSGQSFSLQVEGLFSESIVILNDSDSERSRAYSEALRAVLIKLTGSEDAIRAPVLLRALESAGEYVDAVSYGTEAETLRDSASLGFKSESNQRVLNINFSRVLVETLLLDAGIPIFDSNRPSVLLWMVVQEPNGERNLITPELYPNFISHFESFSKKRGIPFIYPLFDFEDQKALNEDKLWGLDAVTIEGASERYGPDSVLAGRLQITPSADLVGLWRFFFQNSVQSFDGLDTEIESYLDAALNRVTTELVSYFAINPLNNDFSLATLRVDGIANLEGYSSLLDYLNTLGLLNNFVLSEMEGGRLEFRVEIGGDLEQLVGLIALDRDLKIIENSERSFSQGDFPLLHYRWTR